MGTLTRKELIDKWPICKHKCKDTNEPYNCCNAEVCRDSKGFYTNAERTTAFTKGQIKAIWVLWDDTTGFWSELGCKLRLGLRSYKCLEYDCRS